MIHRANSGTKSNLLDQFNTVRLLIVTHSNTAPTSNRYTSVSKRVSKRTSTHHCPASHLPLVSSCWAPNDCPFWRPMYTTKVVPSSSPPSFPTPTLPCLLLVLCRVDLSRCVRTHGRARPHGIRHVGDAHTFQGCVIDPPPPFSEHGPGAKDRHMRGEVEWLEIRGKNIYLQYLKISKLNVSLRYVLKIYEIAWLRSIVVDILKAILLIVFFYYYIITL